MKKIKDLYRILQILGVAALLTANETAAQTITTPIATELTPYIMKGRQSPFKRNISFAGYQTSLLSRTFGSIFYIKNINLINPVFVIEGIPLLQSDKQKRKDIFHFSLNRNGNEIASVECRAFMKKKESFRLLKNQDSSFWGTKNTDILIGAIRLNNDTATQWNLMASNLNASQEEDQQGKIVKGDEEISFLLTNLVLKESTDSANGKNLFATLNMVYAFYYKGLIVAAVSVKEAGRKFWIEESLRTELKDVIAATSSILTMRQNLYE